MPVMAPNLIARLPGLIRREPVRAAAIIAAALVFLAAQFGIVLDESSTVAAVLFILPILGVGEVARGQVVPVEKLTHDPAVIAPDAVNQP